MSAKRSTKKEPREDEGRNLLLDLPRELHPMIAKHQTTQDRKATRGVLRNLGIPQDRWRTGLEERFHELHRVISRIDDAYQHFSQQDPYAFTGEPIVYSTLLSAAQSMYSTVFRPIDKSLKLSTATALERGKMIVDDIMTMEYFTTLDEYIEHTKDTLQTEVDYADSDADDDERLPSIHREPHHEGPSTSYTCTNLKWL